MVTVKYLFVFIPLFIQGVVSSAGAEQLDEDTGNLLEDLNYAEYQYHDHYHDHHEHYHYDDYLVYDVVHPSHKDNYAYDYYNWDYADNYNYPEYNFNDQFAYGDRNNPMDTIQHSHEQVAVMNQLPWVYIVVPVVTIDIYYVNDDRTAIEDIDLQLPVETYMFELGDFGMGHLDLGDWGISEWYDDYYNGGAQYGPEYDYMVDYMDYDHRPPPADLYKTGDQLDEETVLQYPGIDHDPFWVDWIFMVPPDDMIPIVR